MSTNFLPKNAHGCPWLFLAPMEGVGDRTFRKAMRHVGGFDEAVQEFLRVPKNAHVQSLAREFNPQEMQPIPLAVQLMGSDLEGMAQMAMEVERLGAHRIDLNCGCPSNTVTGRGAGSKLLTTPLDLFLVARALVTSVKIPVTIKMRSGYDDTTLFEENLLAAQESGIVFLTLHPRTKADGYLAPANWELIARAKSLLKIPVVGNGDILNVTDALNMLQQTNCDALMIGRGAVINPFIFHQIKAHFAQKDERFSFEALSEYLHVFVNALPSGMPDRLKINKLKQILSFVFRINEATTERKGAILTYVCENVDQLLQRALLLLEGVWRHP